MVCSNGSSNHHCAGLSVQLLLSDDLLMEVIHHHGSLLGDDIQISLHFFGGQSLALDINATVSTW